MLGGAQRQVGVVAAAGIVGIRTMIDRLKQDHERATRQSVGLNSIFGLSATKPQTNIVQVDVSGTSRNAQQWIEELETAGIKTRPWEPQKLHCYQPICLLSDDRGFQIYVSFGSQKSALPCFDAKHCAIEVKAHSCDKSVIRHQA
jgi:hypothetical protein